jgi:hypothetical protein
MEDRAGRKSAVRPIWKRITTRVVELGDQFTDQGAPPVKGLHQVKQPLPIVFKPVIRDFRGASPKLGIINLLDSSQHYLKRVPTGWLIERKESLDDLLVVIGKPCPITCIHCDTHDVSTG